MKLLLLTFILFNNPKEIEYHKLGIEDFKGIMRSDELAKGITGATYTEWSLADSSTDGKVYFTLSCRFVPESSWLSNSSQELIEHENLHWAISFMRCKQFAKILSKYQGIGEKDKQKVINIFNHYWQESEKLQRLYDKECQHGNNRTLQIIWGKNIYRDIKKLE